MLLNLVVQSSWLKKGAGPLCVDRDKPSFSGEFFVPQRVLTSKVDSWRGLHPPWSPSSREPHYPPGRLPGSFCGSVNATSFTPRCLSELSQWEENREEETRVKKTRGSFSLSPRLFKEKEGREKCWPLHSQASAASQTPLTASNLEAQRGAAPVQVVNFVNTSTTIFANIQRNTYSLRRHYSWLYSLSTAPPKLSLHGTALSSQD